MRKSENKKLKIGINLLFLYEITGIGIYVKNLLENFGEIDKEDIFFIFTSKNPPKEILFKYQNFKYIKFTFDSHSKLKRIFAEQVLLPIYLIKYKCDILFNPSIFNPLFAICKKITTIHDGSYLNDKRIDPKHLYLRFVIWCATKSESIITVSNFSKGEILNICKKIAPRLKVVYNGAPKLVKITDEETEKIFKKFDTNSFFFYVGLIVPHKNIENTLQAFKNFSINHPKIKFILSGREVKDLIDIKSIIEKFNLKEKVILTGSVGGQDKVLLYKNSLALVFLSLHEGFGLPILEAQSIGVPVLASNVTALPEVGGDGALYVNPYDTEEIARGMERIAFDENLREDLIQKGFDNIKRFSWRKAAKQLLNIFHSL